MSGKEGSGDLPSATDIYTQTLEWVISAGCEKFVPKQLIEDFAFTRRSYLEAEYMNKKLGRVVQGGKQSPYVRTALEYMKVSLAYYREIFSVVAQNSTKDYDGKTTQDNMFLKLLSERGF